MKYELINQPNKNFSAIQQILYNRGIAEDEILHYINLSDQDINSPLLLGEQNLKQGLMLILNAIKQDANAVIIVDCDCDGYTSAAMLYNYLSNTYPEITLDYVMHAGKQHGLSEDINIVINNYIKYFNTQRLAYSLNYKNPVQYRTEQGFK